MILKKKNLKVTKYAAVFILLFAVVNLAYAQDDKFSKWDKDNNDKISNSEFREEFSNEHYSEWDLNDDEKLTNEEFYKSTFKVLDKDDDNHLDAAETEWGYDYLYGDYVNYNYEVKEGEKSARSIDFDTYRESVQDTEFYSESDKNKDSNVDKTELSESVFHNLDKNDDGTLSNSEFAVFNRYYLDEDGSYHSKSK